MYNTYQYVVIPSVDNALSYLYVHVLIVDTYLDVFFCVWVHDSKSSCTFLGSTTGVWWLGVWCTFSDSGYGSIIQDITLVNITLVNITLVNITLVNIPLVMFLVSPFVWYFTNIYISPISPCNHHVTIQWVRWLTRQPSLWAVAPQGPPGRVGTRVGTTGEGLCWFITPTNMVYRWYIYSFYI